MNEEYKKQRARAVQVLQRHYNWFLHIGYKSIMKSISKYERMIITLQKQQENKVLFVKLELDLDKLKVDSFDAPYLRITRRTTVNRTLRGFDLRDEQGNRMEFHFTRYYREKTIWI